MSTVKTQKIFVGVDVSKFTLDVFHPDTGELSKLDNTEIAVEGFCRSLKKKKRSVMVVMEATGGYETLLLNQLAKHKIDAAVLNPKRVRDFTIGHRSWCSDDFNGPRRTTGNRLAQSRQDCEAGRHRAAQPGFG